MAAKGKYSPAVVKTICASIEDGLRNNRAALAAGISEDTFYTWLKERPDFSEAVKAAEARGMQKRLQTIIAASTDSWQAAAWILERRFPNEYGKIVQEQQGAVTLRVEYVNDWRSGVATHDE